VLRLSQGSGLGSTGVKGRPGIGSSIGEVVQFPISPDSANQVMQASQEFLHRGEQSESVSHLARSVLSQAGANPGTPQAAQAIQTYISDTVGYTDDPVGMESITSPDEFASMLAQGQVPKWRDCDDTAILAASLARQAGLPADIAYYDLDNDGELDHAMARTWIQGRVYGMETTVPGGKLTPETVAPLATIGGP